MYLLNELFLKQIVDVFSCPWWLNRSTDKKLINGSTNFAWLSNKTKQIAIKTFSLSKNLRKEKICCSEIDTSATNYSRVMPLKCQATKNYLDFTFCAHNVYCTRAPSHTMSDVLYAFSICISIRINQIFRPLWFSVLSSVNYHYYPMSDDGAHTVSWVVKQVNESMYYLTDVTTNISNSRCTNLVRWVFKSKNSEFHLSYFLRIFYSFRPSFIRSLIIPIANRLCALR